MLPTVRTLPCRHALAGCSGAGAAAVPGAAAPGRCGALVGRIFSLQGNPAAPYRDTGLFDGVGSDCNEQQGLSICCCLLVVSRLAAATQLAALGSTWLHVGFFSVLPLLIFQLISTGSSALAATLGALVTIAGRCRPAPLQCALARWQSGQTGRLFTLAQWCQDPAASTAAPCRLLRPRPRCRLTPGRSAMSHCSRASALALASF